MQKVKYMQKVKMKENSVRGGNVDVLVPYYAMGKNAIFFR
jgi:hypothetical protein